MATWPTLQDPATPSIPVMVQTRSETGRSIDTSGAFGNGVTRPFRRDRKNDFASDNSFGLLAANIGQILGTIASSANTAGELPWRTEFGSLLHILRLRNNDSGLAEEAKAYVADALHRWEPRVQITSVQIERQDTTLVIRVRWRPRAQGTDRVVVAGLETEIALG